MLHDDPKPELELAAIDIADISPCQAFVQSEAEAGDLTHYAGMAISRIMHAIGEEGGWFVSEGGKVRGLALAPRFANCLALLPLPMIAAETMNRGVQCLFHSVQLIAALHSVAPEHALAGIAIDFPADRLPSPQAINEFGLCAVIPETREHVVNLPTGGLRRYVVLPGSMPGVAADLIQLLGRHVVSTEGSAGEAWIYCPPRYSPLREGYRWLLSELAAGRLSVIGLPDIPDLRFG